MEQIIFSLATTADAALLASSRIAFLTELLGEQTPEDIAILNDELISYFKAAIPEQSYVGLIAKHAGDTIATGGMVFRQQPGSFKNPSGKTAYILNMYTVPGFRRRGIGTAIMTQLMEIAQSKGYHSFELHATPDGEPVYKKMGFYKHGEPTYRKHTTPSNE